MFAEILSKTASCFTCTISNVWLPKHVVKMATATCLPKHVVKMATATFRLYRYVTRTNVSFFDPGPNNQRTEHSCA